MSSSSSTTSTTCYYRNGTVATNDVPCPGSEQCCPNGDTCMSNGLCRDKNNHPNGTATTFSDGHTYNYTGLYYTPSCQDVTYNGCLIDCTTYSSGSGEYIWACNDALTAFCCHLDSDSLGQRDCCTRGLFTLAAPSQTTSAIATSAYSILASTSPTSPATSTTFAAMATSPAAQPTSSGATSSHNSNANSLSSGAKAGIGIGAAAVVIIILVLAALLYRSNRRTRSGSSDNLGNRETYMRSELDSKNMPANYGRSGMTELEAPAQPNFYAA